jgi:hypothetical protein
MMPPKVTKLLNALPMLSLFAWGAVTAFPTSEEKGEIIASQREEAAINAALGQMMTDAVGGEDNSDIETPPLITAEDFRRGFVLTQTLTNEVHDFSAPEGAIVCEKWRLRGANEDAFVLAATDEAPWMFPFGTSVFSRVRVYSSGVVKPVGADGVIEVFKANLGIVPQANWELVFRGQESGVSSQGAGVRSQELGGRYGKICYYSSHHEGLDYSFAVGRMFDRDRNAPGTHDTFSAA